MIDNVPASNLSSPATEPDSGKCSEQNQSSRDAEQTQIADQKLVDVPPNGGYGWVCVACVFWINAHTWGINSVGSSALKTVTDFFVWLKKISNSPTVSFLHTISTTITFPMPTHSNLLLSAACPFRRQC